MSLHLNPWTEWERWLSPVQVGIIQPTEGLNTKGRGRLNVLSSFSSWDLLPPCPRTLMLLVLWLHTWTGAHTEAFLDLQPANGRLWDFLTSVITAWANSYSKSQSVNVPSSPFPFLHIHLCLRRAVLRHFSHVWLFATLWTVAHQAPLSMGVSRQEYWTGLPCPPPGDLYHPGIELLSPVVPALQADSLPLSQWGSPYKCIQWLNYRNAKFKMDWLGI